MAETQVTFELVETIYIFAAASTPERPDSFVSFIENILYVSVLSMESPLGQMSDQMRTSC